jgi:hypothetical protein
MKTLQFRNYPTHRRNWLLLLTLPLLLASCVTPALHEIKTDPCAGWSPIYASKKDTLTAGTAQQILVHDCHGVKEKCWADPAPKGTPSVCASINATPTAKGTQP